ncbi:MAG TPA: UDP-N-acetylmuramate dehydrogenase [Candidatus Nanoarchaeia archaeon]|nr:UDP-N-acetylmuramate dehydrogenase [Candidatus Nanoarchaeia archaeon]
MFSINSNERLAPYTSFRIGGPASFLIEADSEDVLKVAVEYAHHKILPIFVLGEGSNVLISDEGFKGLVIQVNIRGVEFPEPNLLVAGAGEHWDDVVAMAVAKNLSGIENLSYIPGSVGATPVQNIGAYGTEIKEVIEWVEAFDPKTMSVRRLTNAECRFGYRNSLFKSGDGKHLIVVRVAFRLKENGAPNISYKDLALYFSGKHNPTITEVRQAVIDIRKKKLPDIKEVGTAGSFFKNPIISRDAYTALLKKYPDMPSFPTNDGKKKIPLAWILDKVCNLNGYREGNVGLYKTQPLALVNFGNGTANEIKNLAEKISNQVKEKTGIEIEWEVVAVN